MARSAEYLCDDWAARQIRRPLALARGLTEIAGWIGGPRPALASAMAGAPSLLRSRVLRLIDGSRGSSGSRAWWWTLVPVPFVVVNGPRGALRSGGTLADVAPTLLALMGIEQPEAMTGRSLLEAPGGTPPGR